MTKVASDLLRPSLHYRREAILEGLSRLGYRVDRQPLSSPSKDDVLVIWNRSPSVEHFAKRYEAADARVIVVENGYIGCDEFGNQLYAVSLGHHSGAGEWFEGAEDRWSPLGVELKPWRSGGREIVVLPQRGIGEPGVGMHGAWALDVVERLKRVTDRPIRVRYHPGKERPDPYDDLNDCWAAVTWASGAGIKALIHGVPVFHEMPKWIGGGAAVYGIENIENPFRGDRLPMLRRLAYAQWTEAEIRSGEPFKCLLERLSTTA